MLEFLKRMCLEISSTWSQRQKWIKSPREKHAKQPKEGNNIRTLENLNIQKEVEKSNVKGKICKSSFNDLFGPPSLIHWCSQGSMLNPCPLMYTPISSAQKPKSQLPARHFLFNITHAIQAPPQSPSSDPIESEKSFYAPSFFEGHYHSPCGSSLNNTLDHSMVLSLPHFLHLSLLHSKNSIPFRAF